MPELRRDFDSRCAYSLQHECRAGLLEIEHFDPRQKQDLIQRFENLFLASRHCNGKKSDTWPTNAELAAGCRFLNPCEEIDYGEQILEDPTTHLLVGMNAAATWHIRVCGLNAPNLVSERTKRARHWATLKKKSIKVKRTAAEIGELIRRFREEVSLMIPEIKYLAPQPGPKK